MVTRLGGKLPCKLMCLWWWGQCGCSVSPVLSPRLVAPHRIFRKPGTFWGFCSQALVISENPIQLLRKLNFLKIQHFLKIPGSTACSGFQLCSSLPSTFEAWGWGGEFSIWDESHRGRAVPGAWGWCLGSTLGQVTPARFSPEEGPWGLVVAHP